MKAYRLKIKRLDFISAVDAGAQGPISNVALIKRAPTGDEFTLTVKVAKDAKFNESIGVVFGYALASTVNGGASPHVDLQGDAVVGGDELIKVALGFAEAGAHSDVMHDCVKDGWVPFVMPLNAETKKAFGLAGDVEGIAIGMQPSAPTYKRFVSGELAAFSIYGIGEREEMAQKVASTGKCTAGHDMPVDKSACPTCGAGATKKRHVRKAVVFTSEAAGHQHAIDLDDPSWCGDHLSTTYALAADADQAHSHAWMFDPQTGAVTIATDSGHDHTVNSVVPSDVLAVFALSEQADSRAAAAAVLEQVLDGGAAGATVDVTIAARDARANSTPTAPISKVDSTSPEPIQMPKTEAEITALEKRLEHAERIAKLSGAHKTHLDTLTGDDAEDFLAKSTAEREAIVAPLAIELEKRNAVEYVAGDGTIYRKSDDQKLVAMAKREDAAIKREQGEVFKRRAAVEISHFGKTVDVRAEILRAVDGIADETTRKDAHEALRGANVAMLELGKRRGVNPGDLPEGDADPLAKFNALVEDFRTKKSIKTSDEALEKFLGTPDGRIAKSAYDATRGYSK